MRLSHNHRRELRRRGRPDEKRLGKTLYGECESLTVQLLDDETFDAVASQSRNKSLMQAIVAASSSPPLRRSSVTTGCYVSGSWRKSFVADCYTMVKTFVLRAFVEAIEQAVHMAMTSEVQLPIKAN